MSLHSIKTYLGLESGTLPTLCFLSSFLGLPSFGILIIEESEGITAIEEVEEESIIERAVIIHE